jgi:YHS domain-containing protein
MELMILDTWGSGVQAGYTCPCGCKPAVRYECGAAPVEEGCCCGNRFVVGREVAGRLLATDGFRVETISFPAPWGESLQAGWLVGPSVHPEHARGLHSQHAGVDYYFCGRGCKLDFVEDPGRYLDPGYVPHM